MYQGEPPLRQLDETKPLKVDIPIHQHIALRTVKLTTGRTLSEIVETAVADYVQALKDRGDLDESAEIPEDIMLEE